MTIPQPWRQRPPLPPQMEERLRHALVEALRQHEARLQGQADPDDIAALVQHRSERARAEILDALARMEQGRYGWCQRCDQPIPADRLGAVPHTRHCAGCAREDSRR